MTECSDIKCYRDIILSRKGRRLFKVGRRRESEREVKKRGGGREGYHRHSRGIYTTSYPFHDLFVPTDIT